MSSSNNIINVKVDSAASTHYIRPEDAGILKNVKPHVGPPVLLPDADKILPLHQGMLPLRKSFSEKASMATVLPILKSTSLLSVGRLCDDGKMIIFDKEKVRAINHTREVEKLINEQKILLKVQCNWSDGLYDTHVTIMTFLLPAVHPGLYPNKKQSSPAMKARQHKSWKKVSWCSEVKKKHLQEQPDISLNELLQEQWQTDGIRKLFAMANLRQPGINIIL